MAEFPAPKEGIALTHFIVSNDVERSPGGVGAVQDPQDPGRRGLHAEGQPGVTGLTQFGHPGRRAIVRLPGAHRRRCSLAHVRRSFEVGLADLQMDHVPPLALELPRPRQHAERALGTQPTKTG